MNNTTNTLDYITHSIILLFVTSIIVSIYPGILRAGEIQAWIDEPEQNGVYTGIATIRGWAVSSAGVKSVEMYYDGVYKTDIPIGGSRKDVGALLPEFPDADKSGFSMAYGYSHRNGAHVVTIKVIDNDGDQKEFSSSFQTTGFESGFIQNSTDIDFGTSTDYVINNRNSFTIKGVEFRGVKQDIRFDWQNSKQNVSITEITSQETTEPEGTAEPEGVTVLPNHAVDEVVTGPSEYSRNAAYVKLTITGEVNNNTPYYISNVWVPINLFNGDQLIDRTISSTLLKVIPPGGKTCFDATLSNDANIFGAKWGRWTSYQFETPQYGLYEGVPPQLTTYNLRGFFDDEQEDYRVSGSVRNDSESLSPVGVVITLYDVKGKVRNCNLERTTPPYLEAGQSGTFEWWYDGKGNITSDHVQADTTNDW